MASIQTVDYRNMPGKARQIREEAKLMNKELTKIYQEVDQLKMAWFGDSYNELIKSFNNMIPDLNNMLDHVVREMPVALETVANNYAKADCGTFVCTPDNTGAQKIIAITPSAEKSFRFITGNVETVQNHVETGFEKVIEGMNKIESIYLSIIWDTKSASETFKASFNKMKQNIVSSFTEIKTQFKKLMDAQKQNTEQAETNNTI